MSTSGLLKFARHGVAYGIGAYKLSRRMSALAFPHKVSTKNARRLKKQLARFARFVVK